MQFTCTAHISYEVHVSANDKEAAAVKVFERLADDIINGSIRTDLFNNGSGAALRFPFLHTVDVKEVG